jgi:hypothetical protein
MRFDKKVLIRRLHIISFSDTHALDGKRILIFKMAQMLDDRVAEHHIERSILERQASPIADNPG